jgi:hypothetical protein
VPARHDGVPVALRATMGADWYGLVFRAAAVITVRVAARMQQVHRGSGRRDAR